jgi:hypothetical protein
VTRIAVSIVAGEAGAETGRDVVIDEDPYHRAAPGRNATAPRTAVRVTLVAPSC